MTIDSEFHFSPERRTIREIDKITSTSLKDAISKNRSILQNSLIVNDDKGADYYDSVSKKIRLALENYTLFLKAEKARVRRVTSKKTKEELKKEWDDVNLIASRIVKLKDELDKLLPKTPRSQKINLQKLHTYKYNIACYYVEIAALAHEKNNIDQAWSAINHTSFLVGELQYLEHVILDEMESKKESKQNSKNAQGKEKHSNIVKKEAIKLITENKPEDGWESKQETIDAIEDSMAKFLKDNKVPVFTPTNIASRLRIWLTKDKVLSAWEANKKSK